MVGGLLADSLRRDGYRATYTIRNSQPFASNAMLRDTPIVAMTASAIQGDREKCQASGMDDYLAKPVKKPNLEKMLVKWAIEGRRKKEQNASKSSKDTRPTVNRAASSFTTSESTTASPHDFSPELDRLEYAQRAAAQKSSEDPSDSALRQQRAEEMAMAVRDDALIKSAEDPRSRLGRGASDEALERGKEGASSNALTVENMQKHSGGSAGSRVAKLKRDESKDDDSSSLEVRMGEDGDSSQTSLLRSNSGMDSFAKRKSTQS